MGNKGSKPVTEGDKDTVEKRRSEAFENWLNQRLTKYFEDTEKHIIETPLNQDERSELSDSVETILGALFMAIKNIDKRLRVKKNAYIKYGSFFEGVEIISPDKFQFYIVIEEFSGQNIEKIEKVLDDGEKSPELVKVYIKDDVPLQWEDYVSKDAVKGSRVQCEPGIVTLFYGSIHKAVECLREKQHDRVYGKYGRLELSEENNAITKHGPTVNLKFAWNRELLLSVDITPVLKYDKIGGHVVEKLTFSDKIYQSLKSVGSVILVPNAESQYYFCRSFAHTEVDIMKNVISTPHKRVYKILKYLIQGYNPDILKEVQIISEPVIKTLVIRHDQMCKKSDEVADCTMAIISKMQTLLQDREDGDILYLSSIYNSQHNVFPYNIAHAPVRVTDLTKAGMDWIVHHLVKELGCAEFYEFGEIAAELIPLNDFILRDDYWTKKVGVTECLKMRQRKFKLVTPTSHNLEF